MRAGFQSIQLVYLENITAVKCTVCSSISSIASGGKTSITDHLQSKNQKDSLLAKFQAGCVKIIVVTC
jgi:hypothetical protein